MSTTHPNHLRLMMVTTFMLSLMFSITLPSLPYYVDSIDCLTSDNSSSTSKSTLFLGLVVSAYSVGQFIASPLVGWWSKQKGYTLPIQFSLVVIIVGNLIYACAWNRSSLVLSRWMVGLGAGVATLARAYVSEVCAPTEVGQQLSTLSAAQALGFVLGPVVALVFYPVDVQVHVGWGYSVRLDRNTGPGWLSALCAAVNLVPFIYHRGRHKALQRRGVSEASEDKDIETAKRNQRRSALDPLSKDDTINTSEDDTDDETSLVAEDSLVVDLADTDDEMEPLLSTSPDLGYVPAALSSNVEYDAVAAWTVNAIFFLVVLGFAIYETLLVQWFMTNYDWTELQSGGVLTAAGIISCLSILIVKKVTSVEAAGSLSPRSTATLSSSLPNTTLSSSLPTSTTPSMALSTTALPWWKDDNTYLFLGQILMMLNMLFSMNPFCAPPVSAVQFTLASLLLFSPGFPLAQASCLIVYSKVLGVGKRHGVMMGLQTSVGCLARIVGPLLGTFLLDVEASVEWEGRVFKRGWIVFPFAAGVHLLGVLLCLYMVKRMKTFRT